MSNADNEISVSVSPEALGQALRSAAAASSARVVLKLAKRAAHAVLRIEIIGTGTGFGGPGLGLGGSSSARLQIAHDVLIDVLRPDVMAKLKEPLCPEPDVRLFS